MMNVQNRAFSTFAAWLIGDGVVSAQPHVPPEQSTNRRRVPRAVKADGLTLAPGAYRVRLTVSMRGIRQPVSRRRWSDGWSSFRAVR